MNLELSEKSPVFILGAVLVIPKVAIQPTLNEVQEVLNATGRQITSVAKGVGQWVGGKPQVSIHHLTQTTLLIENTLII